jgi:hypothetical protein
MRRTHAIYSLSFRATNPYSPITSIFSCRNWSQKEERPSPWKALAKRGQFESDAEADIRSAADVGRDTLTRMVVPL